MFVCKTRSLNINVFLRIDPSEKPAFRLRKQQVLVKIHLLLYFSSAIYYHHGNQLKYLELFNNQPAYTENLVIKFMLYYKYKINMHNYNYKPKFYIRKDTRVRKRKAKKTDKFKAGKGRFNYNA